MSDLLPGSILITGAGGWLGRRLTDVTVNGLPDVPRIQRPANLRVRAMVMPGQESELKDLAGKVEIVTGDLCESKDCERFCAGAEGALLLHTAGIIHPRKTREFYDINLQGAKNLLAAAQAARVKRAVMVSSNSPCGVNPTRDHRFDENAPYNPYMGYGKSKMLMEQAVHAVEKEGKLETVIVRPPWFYGPYQPPRQTLFFTMIRDGKAPIVGDGNNPRSMAYIDNLCQGLLLAGIVPQARGRTYWIADERPYTMNEIVDTVEKLLETEFKIPCAHKRMRLPGLASKVAYGIDAVLQGLGMYHQKIHVLSEMNKSIACSIDRAKKELGYQPTVALEEGMRRSLAWCLEHQSQALRK